MSNEEHHVVTVHDRAVLNRIFNPNLPYGDVIQDDSPASVDRIDEEDKEEVLEAKRLETEGVRAAEAGDIFLALNLFSQAVDVAPNRASGYNNRAQALRLKGEVQEALQDLNKAIELSQGRGDAACQAYTQRGLINRLEGKDDEALSDFKAAAELGGQFAKQQVVALNPYAAMCNKMLTEMFQKIRSGEMPS